MSEGSSSDQSRVSNIQRCRKIHWGVVAALWGLALAWITVGPFTGDHSNAVSRWMQGVSLMLFTAAGSTLFAWLVQYLVTGPQGSGDRKFELGYYAGRADALNEMRPSLGVVTSLSDRHGRTGT